MIDFEQINHNPAITTEDYAYEIKGAGLFSRDLLFSLKSPVYVKAGEQVSFKHCYLFFTTQEKCKNKPFNACVDDLFHRYTFSTT